MQRSSLGILTTRGTGVGVARLSTNETFGFPALSRNCQYSETAAFTQRFLCICFHQLVFDDAQACYFVHHLWNISVSRAVTEVGPYRNGPQDHLRIAQQFCNLRVSMRWSAHLTLRRRRFDFVREPIAKSIIFHDLIPIDFSKQMIRIAKGLGPVTSTQELHEAATQIQPSISAEAISSGGIALPIRKSTAAIRHTTASSASADSNIFF